MDSITYNKLEYITSGSGLTPNELNEIVDLMDEYARIHVTEALRKHVVMRGGDSENQFVQHVNKYFKVAYLDKTPKERDTLDLLELVCQLHSRSLNVGTKEMHDAYVEARQELESRIVANNNFVLALVSGELPESERIYFSYRDENGEAQHGYMDKDTAGKTLGELMSKEAIVKNIMKELEGNLR